MSPAVILDTTIGETFTFAETFFGFIIAADSCKLKEPTPKYGGNAQRLQVSQGQEEKEQNIPPTLSIAVLSLD